MAARLFHSPLLVVLSVFIMSGSAAQISVTSEPGQSCILPCRDLDNGTIIFLEWTRTDLESGYVLRYRNGLIDTQKQHMSFRNRADLQNKLMNDGDVSLGLENVRTNDTGTYECLTVQRGRNPEKKLISTINLHVASPEPFPSWATALLVLVLVGAAAGLLYHFRHFFMSVPQMVKLDSGEKSVLLPCRTRPLRPGDARVEWRDSDGDVVHVYENDSDHPEEQNQFYRNRTKMKRNPLRTGDLSLTLEHPTDGDTNIYTCSVFSWDGHILMKKQVDLQVKVPQVKVESDMESVLLPCRTTVTLTGDARVEWRDQQNDKIYVHENGSDHLEEQHQFYRNRIKMNEDLLRTGDLSLTLKYPTDRDTNTYTCIVSRGEENILMEKQVRLRVKVHQVEMEQGVESVLLPFTTTPELPGDAKVVWWDRDNRKVHVYKNGSDHPEEQHQFYSNRTKMNEDLLRTGDLSLTLMRPTERDIGEYRCGVWKDDQPLRWKTFHLTVKAKRIPVR